MSSEARDPQVVSASIIRQWMEEANELIVNQARSNSDLFGSNDFVHKIRLMRKLASSLPEPEVRIDVEYLYACEDCGHEFDVPRKYDASDQKGSYFVDLCPKCESHSIPDIDIRHPLNL